ncbi:MAG: hypothetical protein M1833_003874 [Piccolia ochrophora]|nr:MAG: hypothetical protein M1833_003874 [Piccolia ochrophora]
MGPADTFGKIFSATYSNVPVYEFNVEGNHVMRRRSDDWINATHILKVANFDKPARTRILEREVQKGVHEKVQGGYGKYQGTWIPLPEGRDLAQRNKVLDKLLPIFDYVPGDRSPPQAPKHTTAASNKPKVPKAAPVKRVPQVTHQHVEDHYDNISSQLHDDDTPDNTTIDSYEDDERLQMSQQSTASRKRKRGAEQAYALSYQDEQHMLYADELLDYFMVSSTDPTPLNHMPPQPPSHFVPDRPIDEQGHTALHWAVAMGDINVVKDLLNRGASTAATSTNGETPLMRAVLFTNNYEKLTMPKLIYLLLDTVQARDYYGSTVFHHIAATTNSRSKFVCARYYCEVITNKLSEDASGDEVARLLDMQDRNGDTALTIAAKNEARKLIRSFLGHGASANISNRAGETADSILLQINARKREAHPLASSSPLQPDADLSRRDMVPPGQSTSLALANSHHSDVALSLTSNLGTLIVEKSKQLAEAFDNDLLEKESHLREVRRLYATKTQELSMVRQQTAALLAAASSSSAFDDATTAITNPHVDEQETADLDALERESASLLEHLQRHELQTAVRAAESRPANTSPTATKKPSPTDPAHLREKLTLATNLHRAQRERRALVTEIVQNHAGAAGAGVLNGNGVDVGAGKGIGTAHGGTADRTPLYKKLIGKCLDIKDEDVENLLPGIYRELEEARGVEMVVDGRADGETATGGAEGQVDGAMVMG